MSEQAPGSPEAAAPAEDAPTRAVRPRASDSPPHDEIEGYEILAEIHRGGQGVVYKAIQKATRRTVALKVLREGPFASPDQRYRFEREVDLVASLQHPHVVTIYDSGISRGRPYYVMEYVKGQPLDEHVAGRQLDVRATLALFRKVCAAVHHAHLRGVIHRDLKPGNILVDANDDPHVLDFGLAKVAGSSLATDGAPVTVTGEFLGTLAYASPEQAHGDTSRIDIRTDVYSLGVILFRCLTGEFPYPVVGSVGEVLRNITEEPPRKPSSLRKNLTDEVDTIVLEALSKDRERRYQSVEALSRDVENYLAGRPIDAKRDSTFYVLETALRRYRVAVLAILLLAGLLTAFGVVVTRQARRIAAERDRAEQARIRSERDAERARLAATTWYSAWVKNESAVPALRRSLELNRVALGDNDPDLALHLYSLAAALELEHRAQEQTPPEVRAEIEGLLREALALRRRALPQGDPQVVESMELLASKLQDPTERRALLAEALALRRMTLAPDDPTLAQNLEELAGLERELDPAAAEQHLREALVLRRGALPAGLPELLATVERLASLLETRGDLAAARAVREEEIATRRTHAPSDRAALADALEAAGTLELLDAAGVGAVRAEALLREAVEIRERALPHGDPLTAAAAALQGRALLRTMRVEDAEPVLVPALEILRQSWGNADPRTQEAARDVATLYEATGRAEEAAAVRAAATVRP